MEVFGGNACQPVKSYYWRSAVNPAKTAEPIEIPFGIWIRVSPGKHILDRAADPHAKEQRLGERTCQSCLTTVCSNRLSLSNIEFWLQPVLDIHASNKTLWYNCVGIIWWYGEMTGDVIVWLIVPFYDFCGVWSIAVNSVYKLQFFTYPVYCY